MRNVIGLQPPLEGQWLVIEGKCSTLWSARRINDQSSSQPPLVYGVVYSVAYRPSVLRAHRFLLWLYVDQEF